MNASTAPEDRDLTLFVPALNEARRIEATLRGLLRISGATGTDAIQIVVVDDGCTDNTAAIVQELARAHPQIDLVRHPENRGLGAGLKTALAHARGRKFLIVPGDNDMPESVLRNLISNSDSADMVMCYFPDRGQRGWMRRALSSLFGLAYAVTFDVHVQYINGPCVYPTSRLRELRLHSTRFSIVAEINVKLLRQGVSFLEIPGHRQVGLDGSTSFSLRNLIETLRVFLSLLGDIHFRERRRFGHRPRRVRGGMEDCRGSDLPLASS
jgi:glycosyltransferase involved in cell wall biosynthesis